jgi:hypothetical protein
LLLARRCEIIEARSLCRLCFTACGSKVEEMHMNCRWKKSFPFRKEWCQKLNKCRRSHHRLLHLGESEEKNREAKRKTMQAKSSGEPARSLQ